MDSTSAFTEEATDTLLTFVANERELHGEFTRKARAGVHHCDTPMDLATYDALCERALLEHSRAVAEWMDDPACDLNDYLVNPAEINWGAIWMHFEPAAQ
jgi:hypothetical protein